MHKIQKYLLLSVAVTVTLLMVAAAGLYLNRNSTLEYLVASFTDFRLTLNGAVSFGLDGDGASIKLSDVILRNATDNKPLLTAGRFQLALKVNPFLAEPVQISALLLQDASGNIVQRKDGSYNWPLATGHHSAASSNWNKRLGQVQLENIQLQLEGFSAEPMQLELKRLQLDSNQKQRGLSLQAKLDQFPIQLTASMQDLSQLLLEQKPARVSASAYIGNINFTASGVAGVQSGQTRLHVAIEAQDNTTLASLFKQALPEINQLSASGFLQQGNSGLQLRDIKLVIAGPTLNVTASGEVTQFDDLELALQLSMASADVGKLSMIAPLAQWPGWEASIETSISYSDGAPGFTNTLVKAAGNKQQISLSAKNLALQHQGRTISDILGDHVALNYQFHDKRRNARPWRYQYQAETISAHIMPNNDVQLATRGHYKKLPVSAEGVWRDNGDFHFDASLAEARASIKGYLRDALFTIDGELTTPTLQPLGQLLDEEAVSVDRARLRIGFLLSEDNTALSHLDLSMLKGGSTLSIKGSIDKLSNLEGLDFKVNIAARQLGTLNHWLTSSSLIVDRTLAALAEPTSFASQGDIAYRKSLPLASPWLSQLMQQLALQSWLDEYPMLNGKTRAELLVSANNNSTAVTVSSLELESSLASLQWSGQINNTPESFAITGHLQADLQNNALQQLATPARITTSTGFSNNGILTLENFHASAGNTDLTARLELTIKEGLQAISGKLAFQTLDLTPYLPATSTAAPGKKTASNATLFSTEDFPLQWLPAYQLDIETSADRLLTPWFNASALSSHITNHNNVLSLSSTRWHIGDAEVAGHFSIDNSKAVPAASLLIRSKDFDPQQIELLRTIKLIKDGNMSLLIQLDGKGSNEQQLAASLNGKISLVSHNITLQGNALDQMAPAVLKELDEKLNPFYDKNKTHDSKIQCGIIHFDLRDGLMEADKSIVLVTPQIVFGAHGALDLKNETLRMQIIPRTRKGLGLSISGTFAEMAVVDGPILEPRISFDAYGAVKTGAQDVAGTILMGPLYWLYLGQAQKFLASPSACEKIIDKVAPQFSIKTKQH